MPSPSLYTIKPVGPDDADLEYHFHSGQQRAWNSKARQIFMLAGTQSGKTSFAPHWLNREILRRGPGDYIVATSTYPLMMKKLLPEFLTVFKHILNLGDMTNMTDKVFRFSDEAKERYWGADHPDIDVETRIFFGSATNPDSLESATAKAAVLDEVGQDTFRVQSWEAIIRRLSLHEGRILGCTTLYNLGWLKQQVYDPWVKGDRSIDIIQFSSITNPLFPKAEFERMKARLPLWKFKMFYLGEFDKPPGLIYDCFEDKPRNQGGHLVEPFAIPPHWPRFVGLDFGGVNTAKVYLAQDTASGVYYLYDAALGGGQTALEHANTVLDATKGTNLVNVSGGAKSEGQWRMEFQAAGLYVQEPPQPDVEVGIDRVYALFKTFQLYVFDDVEMIKDELGTYSRVLDEATNEPTEKIKDKEKFHGLDGLRYIAQALSSPSPVWGSGESDPMMAHFRPGRINARPEPHGIVEPLMRTTAIVADERVLSSPPGTQLLHKFCGYKTSTDERTRERRDSYKAFFCGGCQNHYPVADFEWV